MSTAELPRRRASANPDSSGLRAKHAPGGSRPTISELLERQEFVGATGACEGNPPVAHPLLKMLRFDVSIRVSIGKNCRRDVFLFGGIQLTHATIVIDINIVEGGIAPSPQRNFDQTPQAEADRESKGHQEYD
jgi:hypothetical protein